MNTPINISIKPAYLKRRYIHIPAVFKHLFPNVKTTCKLKLIIDGTLKETTFYSTTRGGPGIRSFGLTDWFKNHPKLKVEDKLILEVRESNSSREYRLEIA